LDVAGTPSPAAFGFGSGIPGPSDRASFFEEQARNRRSTWRLAALCSLAILLMGVAVSLLAVPALLFTYLIATGIAGLIVPDALIDIAQAPAWAYLTLIDPRNYPDFWPLRIIAPLFVVSLPGIFAATLGWLLLRRLFARHGVGAMLLALGAREPDPNDIEERQIVNIAEEMAIAAGLPAPRVRILDEPVANAAVVGSSPRDATLIIPRRLLDELDRDATQGVLGHLIGSVGNGDLAIAMLIVSVFQTSGLLLMALEAPLSASSRRGMWRIVRSALGSCGNSAEQVHLLDDMLTERLDADSTYDDEIQEIYMSVDREDAGAKRFLYHLRAIVLAPFILIWAFSRFLIGFSMIVLVGPLIALTWRTRRYLADATAVQLTRNPDGIGEALIWLADHGAVIPAGKWADHLFIIGPEAAKQRAEAAMTAEFERLREEYRDRPLFDRLFHRSREALATQRAYSTEIQAQDTDTFGERRGVVIGFHPSLKKRLERLRRQGANVGLERATKEV